jgi:hypothetical protein
LTTANASGRYGTASASLSANATAEPSATGSVEGGTVTFSLLDGTRVLGSATAPLIHGTASATIALPTGVTIGAYAINASYSGTNNYVGSVAPPATFSLNCPATLSVPIAIVDEDGRIFRGMIEGTETTVGSLCSVDYRLVTRGITIGHGTFKADHAAPGVIVITDGTFFVGSIRLPLTFSGRFDVTAGTTTMKITFASGRPSKTVRVTFTRAPNGDYVITSVTIVP